MAKFNFKNATCLFGPLDISGDTNQVMLDASATELNTANFAGNGWREIETGLKNGSGSYSGFLEDAAEPDSTFFAKLGTANVPATFTITNPIVAANTAWAMQVAETKYTNKKMVGELYGFDLAFAGNSPIVRGVVLGVGAAVAVSGTTTPQQVGAVVAGKKIYAALHVTALTGTTVSFTAKVQSDTSGFGSATDRITFTAVTDVTGVSSQWATPVAGPITDDYWRVSYAITGTGTFTYRMFFGIL